MDHLVGRFFKSERSLVIAGDKDVCVIDPGFSYDSVDDVLNCCQCFKKPVSHVILSHAHNDHIANLEYYVRAFPSVRVIVSPNSPFAHSKEAEVYADRATTRIAGVDIHFLHTPGHSQKMDDLSVYFPSEKVLYCGDMAQPQGNCVERATFASPVPFYYDGGVYLKSIETLLGVDFALLVTGHGDVCLTQEGRNWLQVTKQVIERSRTFAFQLCKENPSENDSRIAEWVFRTIAHERALSPTSVNERMRPVEGISDYERYDLPGIRYWVKSARKKLENEPQK